MSGQSFYFKGKDGKKLYGVKWVAEEKPRALLQIAHGMAEHIGRYAEFADFLVSRGVHVYGNDHRGHGHTASTEEDRGYYGDENGFETVVHDMKELTAIMKQDYPDIPVFLLGHSMGSFLSRRYIQLYGEELDGVIFTGTGGHPGLLGKVGHYLSVREARKQGRRAPSRKMNALTFGPTTRPLSRTRRSSTG
ncbi:alpha/beta hydrolase [Mesobacillus campisalis]|uniref:alpha/beta hydrolase n=1 Tax=Mesobacillus campisalis TaxID=1408103 RepID=UPI000B1436A6|nr:alpha/beta hydrolase [Mesobacillus campisalis]